MSVDVVFGMQRGDEGKGRVVDMVAGDYDIVARFNGGPNAGHTIATESGHTLKLHQVPSGITRPEKLNIIGNGALVDPVRLIEEIKDIQATGLTVSPDNLAISNIAHLIMPHHISLDEIREGGKNGQGSTKRGIAYAACEKYAREGVRTELITEDPDRLYMLVINGLRSTIRSRQKLSLPEHDLIKEATNWTEKAIEIAPYLKDTVRLLQTELKDGKKILAEGAQAFGLDIELGMYPYVTSSHTTSASAAIGLGVAPQHLEKVIGVAKAIKSHVGGGPFVTKITDAELENTLRGKPGLIDSEYGASTGRLRDVGYLDLPELRKAIEANGVTEIALTKVDTVRKFGRSTLIATAYELDGQKLSEAPSSAIHLQKSTPVYEELPVWPEDISNIRNYSDLPEAAKKYIEFISENLETPVTMLGVGPHRDQVIINR